MSSFNRDESTAIADCMSAGRLSHAVLIEDENPGTALARAKEIAGAMLCSGENPPCGQCRDCEKVQKGIHPDLIILSGGERIRSFHVDLVREIRREAHILPNESESKVFLLENAQNMTVQAQNALLKILEEPPSGVSFILTCDNKASLLSTVLSRVSAFSAGEPRKPEADARENGRSDEAKHIIAALLAGDELSAMAAFSPYERDRAGFERLLDSLYAEAAGELSALVKSGGRAHEKAARLMKITGIAGELKTGLAHNAGGLLMTVMMSAKLYDS